MTVCKASRTCMWMRGEPGSMLLTRRCRCVTCRCLSMLKWLGQSSCTELYQQVRASASKSAHMVHSSQEPGCNAAVPCGSHLSAWLSPCPKLMLLLARSRPLHVLADERVKMLVRAPSGLGPPSSEVVLTLPCQPPQFWARPTSSTAAGGRLVCGAL